MDLPEDLKNKEVEILVYPHEKNNDSDNENKKAKNVRGTLENYKNKELHYLESDAWAEAVKEKNENS